MGRVFLPYIRRSRYNIFYKAMTKTGRPDTHVEDTAIGELGARSSSCTTPFSSTMYGGGDGGAPQWVLSLDSTSTVPTRTLARRGAGYCYICMHSAVDVRENK